MTGMDDATRAQIRAAQPGMSTWLSANAGSGKTRVLTDRVARLLLKDVPPQNILCLTFTKAAAAEMQNRLFKRLGEWSMLDDPALSRALAAIGEPPGVDATRLAKARRLFARAIETPGGLKIQTIHSFCSTLLRRFPLEAGVPPGFKELDDLTAGERLTEALDKVAIRHPEIFDAFASLFTGLALEGFAGKLTGQRDAYSRPPEIETILAKLGLPGGYDEATLLAETFPGGEREVISQLVPYLLAGSSNDAKAGAALSQIPDAPRAFLHQLFGCLLFGATAACPFGAKIGKFPTKATRERMPPALLAELETLMARVELACDRGKRLDLAQRSFALHRFAHVFLPEYDAAKAVRGELDFDDLILKARDLLTREGVAQWVLFRLDGGIDHILVDEAQDTAPIQWQVIDLISREITAGSGTRDAGERTIFVVGDKKQSIYGFQGADPDGFERMAEIFTDRLGQHAAPPQRLELQYSFRSAAPVLRVVDEAFPDAPSAMGGALNHIAFHDRMPGRVDLWPFIEKGNKVENDTPWHAPVDMVGDQDPDVRLGRRIASEIARIQQEESLFEPDGEAFRPRPIHDGDFLILVQRRKTAFQEVIRACKAAGLAVAGADRVRLTEALAVKDILALLSFLMTPEDDLALASALRSPLFDWSEDALYRLAAPRGGKTLWQALRDHGPPGEPARAILSELLNRADFERPYELIDRILREHDGRPRLLTRLGVEVEESIDLLLSTALAYEQAETPSLTGFLAWLEASRIEIKRGQESGGRAIRVMTVHGAKGLESPIVILAESGDRRPPGTDGAVDIGAGMPPLWKPAKPDIPVDLAPRFTALAARQEEERLRLQYVAMTRAEQWLIVCGAGTAKQPDNWYLRTEAAMARVGAIDHAFDFGPGLRYENARPAKKAPPRGAPDSAGSVGLPAYARSPVPVPDRPRQILSPSALPGPKTLPGEGAGDPDAMARGTALHMLLEHLPATPPDRWHEVGRALLQAHDPLADTATLGEAIRVLEAPELAPLFQGRALTEVSVNARLPELGGQPVQGTIDRLIVTGSSVTAIDYKSNATIPARPEDTPSGLLAQMGAYAAALARIYPARSIGTAILWTTAPRLDMLPHDLVTAALVDTASA